VLPFVATAGTGIASKEYEMLKWEEIDISRCNIANNFCTFDL